MLRPEGERVQVRLSNPTNRNEGRSEVGRFGLSHFQQSWLNQSAVLCVFRASAGLNLPCSVPHRRTHEVQHETKIDV
jgi:hypothetical protein